MEWSYASRGMRCRATEAHRHTCVTTFVRAGTDVILVADSAGHRRLDTTRRPSLPSEADRDAAVKALLAP